MEALLQILDYADVPLMLSECLKNLDFKMNGAMVDFFQALADLPAHKLPGNQLGVLGAYSFLDLKNKDLRAYGPLRSCMALPSCRAARSLTRLSVSGRAHCAGATCSTPCARLATCWPFSSCTTRSA
jgi:hypothetical protein